MKKEQVKLDTSAFRTQKINELSWKFAGSTDPALVAPILHVEKIKKEYVFTNELCKALDIAPAVLASWVKDVNIPYTYQQQPGNEGGSPSRRYEAIYIPLFVDLAILNRLRRIDLIKLVLGATHGNYIELRSGTIRYINPVSHFDDCRINYEL